MATRAKTKTSANIAAIPGADEDDADSTPREYTLERGTHRRWEGNELIEYKEGDVLTLGPNQAKLMAGRISAVPNATQYEPSKGKAVGERQKRAAVKISPLDSDKDEDEDEEDTDNETETEDETTEEETAEDDAADADAAGAATDTTGTTGTAADTATLADTTAVTDRAADRAARKKGKRGG